MAKENGIGIFKATDKPVGFFEVDSEQVMTSIIDGVNKLLGEGHELSEPTEDGLKAKRVGELQLVIVEDDTEYLVKTASTKETADRSPGGESGTWDVQSVIFSKDSYTLEEAKSYLSDQDKLGDYGVEETDTAYRFRQYDPKYFTEFKTISMATGVSGVHGMIVASADGEEDTESDDAKEKAAKAAELSIEEYEAIKALNEVVKKKLKVLPGTCNINKAEDGTTEERFVLSLVLEPNDGQDGAPLKPDTQDDVYSAKAVRNTAHQWMEHYGSIDLMHNWQALGKENVRVLESYIAPADFSIGEGDDAAAIVKGTWMLALRIVNDDLWEAVKTGDIGAYSIGGTATRTPIGEE